MSTYTVVLTSRARRQLRKLSASVQKQIKPVIDALAENPRPEGVKKLKGMKKGIARYRVRSGNYRIIYEIDDNFLRVDVVDIKDRREAYS